MKRDAFTHPLGFGREKIVDNFAGGGGASEAIFQALGRHPDVAINHDGEALAMHQANHPTTMHFKEDVFLVHPGFVTQQEPIGLAWFSPTCTHFSRAKGGNLLNQKMRGLAWVALKWAAMQKPRVVALENVPEFLGWSPLKKDGRPDKRYTGRTFKAFVLALTTGLPASHPDVREIYETLGADFPMDRLVQGLGYKVEWKLIRACDFGAPTIRQRLFMVMRNDGQPIVWPDPTHGDPKSLEVQSGKRLPWATTAECIDWSVECPSIFERKKALADATLRRVGKGLKKYLIDSDDPFIAPAHAVSVGAQAAASMVQTGYGERAGQSPRSLDIQKPLGTVVAGGVKHAVVTATMVDTAQADVAPSGVKRWGKGHHDICSPMGAVTASGNRALATAYLVKNYTGVVGAPLSAPAPTVTAVDHNSLIVVDMAQTVAAHIQRQMGQSVGHSADVPAGTIMPGGAGKTAIVTSNLIKLRGTSTSAATNAPLGTVSAGGTHHAEVRTELTTPGAGNWKRQALREFLWEFCPGAQGNPTPELVMVRGEPMEIIDIGLRMLIPRELANAQGFPRDYVLDAEHVTIDKKGRAVTKRLSKTAQVRMIGNSVSPPPACALIRANFVHEQKMVFAA